MFNNMYRISRKRSYLLKTLLFMIGCFVFEPGFGQMPFDCDNPPDGIGAGNDRVICQNASTIIGACLNDEYDVFWVAVPPDPNFFSQAHLAEPLVSPTQSTTYVLTLTDPNDPNSFCTDFVYVIVFDNGTLSIGNDDIDVANSGEAMEERMITIEANINGALPIGYDEESSDLEIQYKFHFNGADEITMQNEVISSYTLNATAMISPEQVLANDPDHFYDLGITLTIENELGDDCNINTPPLSISVYRLFIDYVRDGPDDKNWKVRVNRAIEYSATASSNCNNWEWDMRDLDNGGNQVWNPVGGNANAGGNMIINNIDLPMTNDKFGATYGTVYVRCEDGDGTEHERYSNEGIQGNQRVKVFYVGTDMNPHEPAVPNWFFYYSDEESGGVGAIYGYSSLLATSATVTFGPGVTETDADITIADNAYTGSFYRITQTTNGYLEHIGDSGNYNYFIYFSGVLTHERWHRSEQLNQCNHMVPGCPCPSLPDSDGDCLYTAEETNVYLTDPTKLFSGMNLIEDPELYPGGPIERDAILAMEVICNSPGGCNDWAAPGTNW